MNHPPGDARRFRQTVALGIAVAALGLACIGGGLAMLTWRLLSPEKAIVLPPGSISTTESTPTPGVLGTPVALPPLPADLSEVAILPVNEPPSPTPPGTPVSTAARATQTPSDTPVPTVTGTPSPTATLTRTPPAEPAISPLPPETPTLGPTRTQRPTLTPSPTLPPAAFPSPVPPPAVPDRILIDAINLDAPVIPVGQHPVRLGNRTYGQWDVPNTRAAGWHQNSASLGQPGNTVLNGHHNTNGEVFRHLVALKPGDVITLESQGRRAYYLVAQTMTLLEEGQPVEVRQQNARWILPTGDERVTLITCWPDTASTHRLIVIAMPPSALGLPADIP